ncbi:unnamed protein product [Paramecium sonneborni]|uniref:Uncharacterized protein n=1 Tax=Paramecium sonneborni TaxID=65129 RepID=A0A8S1RP13_9CILI|nr:unnamed protein product [Paramecium sonneborni]
MFLINQSKNNLPIKDYWLEQLQDQVNQEGLMIIFERKGIRILQKEE